MKRGRKRRKANALGTAASTKLDLQIIAHPFNGLDPAAVRQALVKLAGQSATKFPELLSGLFDTLRSSYPPQIIATVAAYGLYGGVSDEGVSSRMLTSAIQQHHVELLQALALTLPREEWGTEPATPDVIQAVVDTIVELADAFHQRRFAAIDDERDQQQRTVLGLQERLRLNTQMVRNWGYFSSVVRISTELYAALDEPLRTSHGFGATDLIEVARLLITLLERRFNDRHATLRKIFRARTIPQLVRQYYARYPDVEGDPEEFIAAIPPTATYDMVMYRLLAHADISLVKMGVASAAELAALTGRTEEVVGRVLKALSMEPGDLRAAEAERFFLDNPVWTKPGMKVAAGYYFATPQVIFSHIHAVMRSLVEAAGLKPQLDQRRAAYLEGKIQETMEAAVPSVKFVANAKWRVSGDTYETDLLGQVDRVVIIVEAKSAALTPQGLRGAPDRVKRHVRDLIVAPAQQSARLEEILWKAKAGDAEARAITETLNLDVSDIDTVIRISVTLDDFSVLSSAERDLNEAGWVPEGLRLAPTLNIADLGCVADILSEPVFFLHYFSERARVQKTMDLIGDELDFLGFYLETGFNSFEFDDGSKRLALTGMSHKLDHYYNSADAGVRVPKPRPRLHPYLSSLVVAVQRRAMTAWTTISLDLLRMGHLEEQRTFFNAMERLRRDVAKTFRDPSHPCSIVITPPPIRDACLVFYLYPQALAHKRHDAVELLTAQVLDDGSRKRCIVIGRNIDNWKVPYQFVGIATPPDDPPPGPCI